MNKVNIQKIEKLKEDIERNLEDLIVASNTANANTYELLIDVQEATEPFLKKLSMVSDMLLDTKVITQSSQKNISLISNSNIFSSKNIEVADNKLLIAKNQAKEVSFIEAQSTIRSILPFTLIDTASNQSTNLNNLFKFKKETKIDFNRVGYSCSLILNYPSKEFINSLILDFGDTKALPNITNIRYLNEDKTPVKILFNNVEALDLNVKLVKENKIELFFDTVFTNQLQIDFASNSLTFFTLENVVSYLNKFAESAEIVFGPIVTNSPILKAAVSSTNVTENVSISLSTDLSTWLTVDEISSLNLSGNNKIISFNTINEVSFKTETDVKTIYVRFIFTNKTQQNSLSNQSFKTIKETNLSRNPLNILQSKYSNYKLKNTPRVFGNFVSKSSVNVNELDLGTINKLLVDNQPVFLGLAETPYSITTQSNLIRNVTYSNKIKKVNYENISAGELDLIGELYDIDVVEEKDVLIKNRTEKNAVFKLKVGEGFYKITSDVSRLTLDLRTGFIDNSSSLTVVVPYSDIKILNEVDQVITLIKKESLDSYNIGDFTIYYINLVNILYEPYKISGCILNTLYPLKELELDEYAVEDGVLIINNTKENLATYYKKIDSKKEYSKHVDYLNGNFLKRQDPEYTVTSSTKILESTNVVKLNHTFLKKGSISFKQIKDIDSEKYNTNLNPEIKFLNIGTDTDPLYLKPDDLDETTYLEI